MGINDLFRELESHRKPHPKEYDEGYRAHHCDILIDDVLYEVRGWNFKNGQLTIAAVNWTHHAGSVSIDANLVCEKIFVKGV